MWLVNDVMFWVGNQVEQSITERIKTVANTRKENGIDRQTNNLYKEFLKGMRKAHDETRANKPGVSELEEQIKKEKAALATLEESFDTKSDFGAMLETMRGHIAALEAIKTHLVRINKVNKELKAELKQKEIEKNNKAAANSGT